MKIKKLLDKYNLKEIIAYLIVGVLTTVVNFIVYYLCTILFLDPTKIIELECANVIAWVIAVIFAYFANRKFVFKSDNNNKLVEGLKFGFGRLFTLLMELFIMFVMVVPLHINDRISKIVCQVIIIIGNYFISKFIVFKKKNKY